MKPTNLFMILLTLGLAPIAFTADEIRTKMVIAVEEGEGDAETRIEFDSEELGFDLHDMQVGENRSFVDEQGRTVLITREQEGFRFDVDGKTIRMPAFHGHHHGPGGHHGAIVVGEGGAEDVDVEILRDIRMEQAHGPDAITILSGKPIDAATQEAIRSLLESAGHDREVHFIDHERPHGGPHRVKVIRRHVEVAE